MATTPPNYDTDVRPIFKAMCFHCHGEEEKPKGRLDMRMVRLMLKGGKSGPAIVPGKPDQSPLWKRIVTDEMPEGHKKLTAAQKATVKLWIEQGAKTPHVEPDNLDDAKFSATELAHWAFHPVKKPPVPAGSSSAIDAFLLAKLKEKANREGFSAQADRRTLIRRVTIDLHGLPPTPAEVEAFVNDGSANAYEKLVDRLLASPRYGERWGRHWLDIAGYAETNGNLGQDKPRPYAWKYRDYVIRSFNADKPYDGFLREQLAGDELAPRPLRPSDPATAELLTATGFLRMAPDLTEGEDNLANRNQAVADTLKVVSTTMGLTVGCAQCHDHRYDPITHEDYHRLRAVFDPTFDLAKWKQPKDRVADATAQATREQAAAIEAQAKAKLDDIRKREQQLAQKIYYSRIPLIAEADRAAVLVAVNADPNKLTEEQKKLLTKYPNIKSVAFIAGFLEEYDNAAFHRFKKEKADVAALRATKPPLDLLMIAGEAEGYTGESRLLFRGDPEQPKKVVTPADLFVISRHRPTAEIPAKQEKRATTGRRLAFAERLTDGQHPLTARVMVNRLWLHHFGKGIVNSPGEFGLNGERPSHPELLDWLAATFVEDGWAIKKMHRRILLTQAYQQVSTRSAQLDQVDPDNRLLGRMSIRRLEAEAVRDSLLSVSGKLNTQMGGASVPVAEDDLGRGVFGKREVRGFSELIRVPVEQEHRRSVYVASVRETPLNMLSTFDLPVMIPNCDVRKQSTVPPQSLMFLNDTEIVRQAEALTERLFAEANDTASRIRLAYRLLYANEPTEKELAICSDFVSKQTTHFRSNGDAAWLANVKRWPHAPDMRAMSSLAQTLLSANRFLYVD
jgi:hypothetical protein